MTSDEIFARAASRLGIEKPNEIQNATAGLKVPLRLLLLAPTGSGKTLAFAVPFLRSLPSDANGNILGIIMAPTRELVLQIFDCIRMLATPEYKATACYGGHDMRTEVNELAGKPAIVVATPGRLLDHLHRGHLSLSSCRTLAIDEYDKALELGFRDEMKAIANKIRSLNTLILTSATKSVEIPDFLDTESLVALDFLHDSEVPVPGTIRYRVKSTDKDKLDSLIALLKDLGSEQSIVFVNHRDAAERIYANLSREGFPVGLYHGGLEQADREQALLLFANGTTRTLVTTDLASRGLDIEDIGSVIHYHIPPTTENWTHRNGRTARMGSEGSVYVIESESDKMPEYVITDKDYVPEGTSKIRESQTGTLYLNAGKKEKISKGDIAGFLMKKGGLEADEVGRIDVKDHCAYVAVPRDKMRRTVENLAPHKLKNTRVRVSQIKK